MLRRINYYIIVLQRLYTLFAFLCNADEFVFFFFLNKKPRAYFERSFDPEMKK